MTGQPLLHGVFLSAWNTGTNTAVGEPVMILKLTDGRQFGVQMPGDTAIALGKALIAEGERATRPPDAQPN
jgi:hypothetical protein